MTPNFNELVNYCISFKKFDAYADERISLIRDLLKSALSDPNFELADDQVIVSSNYSDAVISDVFYSLYNKFPKKITPASDESKIVSFV